MSERSEEDQWRIRRYIRERALRLRTIRTNLAAYMESKRRGEVSK